MDIIATRDADQDTSLGFMELLGYQDYFYDTIFDNMNHHYKLPPSSLDMEMKLKMKMEMEMEMEISTSAHKDEVEEESSVVLNGQQPSSPNCSSIISSPDHHQPLHKPVVEQCNKEKKRMGGDTEEAKTKKKKKDKEERFAFMTRTEVDHLDDGYRWRKYGQKAVKNSHFPRSYYRCTSASCNVKKRVERCMGDPSYVTTTYEGQHNHPVSRNSKPLITPFDHLNTTTAATIAATPPAMLKLEQGGLLQDMTPFYH